jgi:hypothetical protein
MRLAVEDAFQAHQFVTPARGDGQQPLGEPLQIHGGLGAQRQRAHPLGVEVIVGVLMVVVTAHDPVLEHVFHPRRIPRLLVEHTRHVDRCPGGPLDVRLLIADV